MRSSPPPLRLPQPLGLTWNGIKPVFVDIEEDSFNIDPSLIEAAITPRTSAIMPVHVFGRPCKTAEIDEIARRYGLKVIYDAARFAVNCDCGTLMSSGDLSVLSFHATKMFHTFGRCHCLPQCRDKNPNRPP